MLHWQPSVRPVDSLFKHAIYMSASSFYWVPKILINLICSGAWNELTFTLQSIQHDKVLYIVGPVCLYCVYMVDIDHNLSQAIHTGFILLGDMIIKTHGI